MVMSLLESLYKSLYKNVKDPALSIFRSPWRPEKSCVFAATVLDPSDTQRQTRTGRPFSVLYRTRPAAFCPYPGGLNFGQIGSASPSRRPKRPRRSKRPWPSTWAPSSSMVRFYVSHSIVYIVSLESSDALLLLRAVVR